MDKIDEVLTRGVAEVLPDKKRLADLMTKRKIRLYQGFDPSSPKLHLGNMIGLRKLAQFQKLGHKVIFLVGDFTGMIGDPTDKSATRKMLSRNQLEENAKSWREQAGKFLGFDGPNPAEILFNSSWLDKVSFKGLIETTSKFTVQQMIERDMFQERIKNNAPIHLHEFLYPVAQALDSVNMDVDLEIGGSDQLFNMLAGRTLMKEFKNKEKFVLTTKLLEDPTGAKMGKTAGNTINLTDAANDIFGQIMGFPDAMLPLAIELLTDLPVSLIDELGPLEAKKRLAYDVVTQIHGVKKAEAARNYFERTFQKREFPEKPLSVKVAESPIAALDLVFLTKIPGSRSEAKRLISQGGVDINGVTEKDPTKEIEIPKEGVTLRIGKTNFVKANIK